MKNHYAKGSLTVGGTVAMGTGVMIGAGIFALTGQVAEFAGSLFPLAFVVAAIISGFSAYSYIKVTRRSPSAGGIAMILHKEYGPRTVTGAAALLMAMSMIINESLVARTFGTYTLQLFEISNPEQWVPFLAVGLIIVAYLVNIAGNQLIGSISKITALLKIGGIALFSMAALWGADFTFKPSTGESVESASVGGFLAAVAIAILAYKGFTTITNSGDEVQNPSRNVGRAIIIWLGVCTVVYLLVSFAVGSSLSVGEIVAAKNYSLAEAARPVFGQTGVSLTVAIAIIATASGLLASVFAVSRMLAMLTDMRLIPHSHFGLSGTIQNHTLLYTVVVAALLAAFFDLGRIASLGAIFYLVMDIIVQWGVYRHLRNEINVSSGIVLGAIGLDLIVLSAFVWIKINSAPWIVWMAIGTITVVFLLERLYLGTRDAMPLHNDDKEHASHD